MAHFSFEAWGRLSVAFSFSWPNLCSYYGAKVVQGVGGDIAMRTPLTRTQQFALCVLGLLLGFRV